MEKDMEAGVLIMGGAPPRYAPAPGGVGNDSRH